MPDWGICTDIDMPARSGPSGAYTNESPVMTAPRVSQADEYVPPFPGMTVLGPSHSKPVVLSKAADEATSTSNNTPAANHRRPGLLLRHGESIRVMLTCPRIPGSVRPYLLLCCSRTKGTTRDIDGVQGAGSDANRTPLRWRQR
jgi:hypothetical protein